MTPEQIGALTTFAVAMADHYDTPVTTPEKTAEHYQLADRARTLRAMVMDDLHHHGVSSQFLRNPITHA